MKRGERYCDESKKLCEESKANQILYKELIGDIIVTAADNILIILNIVNPQSRAIRGFQRFI